LFVHQLMDFINPLRGLKFLYWQVFYNNVTLPAGRVCCTSLLCHLVRSERSNLPASLHTEGMQAGFFRKEMLHPSVDGFSQPASFTTRWLAGMTISEFCNRLGRQALRGKQIIQSNCRQAFMFVIFKENKTS